jgi:hypothetical protein
MIKDKRSMIKDRQIPFRIQQEAEHEFTEKIRPVSISKASRSAFFQMFVMTREEVFEFINKGMDIEKAWVEKMKGEKKDVSSDNGD